jgi:IS5 family transposase
VFGYDKVRYHGLMKNAGHLRMLAAFSNLLRARK